MSRLRLYNTLTRQLEEFEPLDPEGRIVTFYSCGPTVYDYAHIGNFRSFLNADVLRRTLELLGYSVRHVMNITDVGHMTDDAAADGAGEDKMQVAARRLREAKKSGTLPPHAGDIDPSDPYAIADFYADAFVEDALKLGMKVVREAKEDPSLLPRPTKFIEPMIELVGSLIDKGHAYVASDGVVYFDVQSFPQYGALSGNTLDDLRSGAGGRVDEHTQKVKNHPADFMLWKPDPRHLMRWPSPWGDGYPGWHLECSVMAIELLAKHLEQSADGNSHAGDGGFSALIDIHSGGEDNIFPHHECEIAQSCCATGRSNFARYWFHTRHLIVEGAKMSKSAGNFYTVRDVLARGASPAALRLELIKTHYRVNANFTFQGLKDSQRQVDRWARLDEWLAAGAREQQTGQTQANGSQGPLRTALDEFRSVLADDLNVARAVAVLSEAAGQYDTSAHPLPPGISAADERNALHAMDSVFGVFELERTAEHSDEIDPQLIEQKIKDRLHARRNRDFATADAIRDELAAMGIVLKDGPDGTTWSRQVG